ncbi:MAG TPA: outer membrane lipoprotein-sorting protein [Firmicutes bacterium]|nr:outer membrane lipoprotein-sorting protein [Bacillota bacterium]
MRIRIIDFLIIISILLASFLYGGTGEKKENSGYSKEYAERLLRGVDDSMYPDMYRAEMEMNTYRKNRRPLEFKYEIHSKGSGEEQRVLMEITSPARDRGKKILMTENNLWMYMPNVSRPIRLSRSQSFMGSTFSNEDLADSAWQSNYDPEIADEKDGKLLLRLSAKRSDVAYARIDMWIDKETELPVKGTYYGLSGRAIKEIEFSNVGEMAGLLRPLDMKMVDLLEEGAYTEVKLIKMEEAEDLPDYMFDQTQMGR